MDAYYVVVCENDQEHIIDGRTFKDDGGPLVMEQYLRKASLKDVRERREILEKSYGKSRIAQLVFID